MASGITLSNGQTLEFNDNSTKIDFTGISRLTDADVAQLLKALKTAKNVTQLIIPDKISGEGKAVFNLLCENHTITDITYSKNRYRDIVYDERIKELLVKNRVLLSMPSNNDELLKEKRKYIALERRNLKALDACTTTILRLLVLGIIVDIYNVYHGKELKNLINGHVTSIGLYSIANAVTYGLLTIAIKTIVIKCGEIESDQLSHMMQSGAMAYCATTFFSTYINKIENPYAKCAITLASAAVMTTYLKYHSSDNDIGVNRE
jgi:hypothetical protein